MAVTQNHAGETPNTSNGETPTESTPAAVQQTLDEWLEGQPEEVHNLFEKHTSGLKSALQSERASRAALEKQIKQLSKQAEEGSSFKAELEKLSTSLSKERLKNKFLEKAHSEHVSDMELAWKAVEGSDLVDDAGNVDFSELKARHPSLFSSKPVIPPANAGNGVRKPTQKPTGSAAMNQFIRAGAGYRT